MNRKVIEDKIKSLRLTYQLTDDYIECQLLKSQIDLLETLLEALP